jgi:hypothetical protein
MSKTRLLILGAGGHGRSVAEAAKLSSHFEVVGFWMIRYLSVIPLWTYPCWVP